jgi:hypothetical protein
MFQKPSIFKIQPLTEILLRRRVRLNTTSGFFTDENYNEWYVQVEENWINDNDDDSDDENTEYFRARNNSVLGQLLLVRPSIRRNNSRSYYELSR